jgi:HD-GYP domain-containing protein (c-di-GMP phosphodiesterase class II)
VCAAEVIAALSLATDLATGLPLEHGLESTLAAMRLAERLGVDAETERQTYYACLLFHVGCTADAHVAADLFGESGVLTHLGPAMFGSQRQAALATLRALAPQEGPVPARALGVARKLPRAVGAYRRHVEASCEVATMLTDRLGLPPAIQELFAGFTERWDGKGELGLARGEEIPLAVRIAHVARDATVQRMIAGSEVAAKVVRSRAGHAFDPAVAACLADGIEAIFAGLAEGSAWDRVLAAEPAPGLGLEGAAIDRALAAMGDFADLASPYLAGHSAGVAQVAGAAAERQGLDPQALRRAAFVHDLGRVAIPLRIWHKPGPLAPDEWERVRLHAYHSERVLARSPFLSALASVASAHHERLDGSGYHRGAAAGALPPAARVLAAADAYCAMTEPRAHRAALSPDEAATTLGAEASAGRLDVTAVAAVLEAAGQAVPRMERPAGLTEREAQVVGLLARGLQTKQVARALGISAKTTDRHIQNAYAKIGVSTRAAAALFAMEHGLAAWGELPIGRPPGGP